jgi:hypothetical protein
MPSGRSGGARFWLRHPMARHTVHVSEVGTTTEFGQRYQTSWRPYVLRHPFVNLHKESQVSAHVVRSKYDVGSGPSCSLDLDAPRPQLIMTSQNSQVFLSKIYGRF